MNDITQVLADLEQGNLHAAEELLPLVYDELRKLAAHRLACEKPGQTLQATALVHEAYVRMVVHDKGYHWNSRGHFFAAAAEAMRRIVIEQARRKRSRKRGGQWRHVYLDAAALQEIEQSPESVDNLLALDEALTRLAAVDRLAARLVTLRYFTGLTMQEAADALGISLRGAERNWTYAKTWLHRELTAAATQI